MPIGLVLDTTAVARYPGLAVGELIAEVADEGKDFAVPVVCLAQAASSFGVEQVVLLLKHPRCRPLPVVLDDVTHLSNWLWVFDRLDRAIVAAAARQHRAYVVSAEPDGYVDGLDLPVIGI